MCFGGQLPPDLRVAGLSISILELELEPNFLPARPVFAHKYQLSSARHFGRAWDGRTGLLSSYGSTVWVLSLTMITTKGCHHLPLPCHGVDKRVYQEWGSQAEETRLLGMVL